MEEQIYKIKSSGIDTSSMNLPPTSLDDFDYVFTSIEANNDFLLKDKVSGKKILTYCPSTKNLNLVVKSHLGFLNTLKIETLFLDPDIDWSSVPETINNVESFGIYCPKSSVLLSDIMKQHKFEYVILPTCPLDFNYEVIEWCEQNKVKIVSINPMGGYISAARNILSFGVPYLLSFAAVYSDIVILSGRDIFRSSISEQYLRELVGKKVNGNFNMKNSIHKSVPKLKQVIYTRVAIDKKTNIEYYDPNFVYTPLEFDNSELSFSFKSNPDIIVLDNLEKDITDLVKNKDYPGEDTHGTFSSYVRYYFFEWLENQEEYENWERTYVSLGNSFFAVRLYKPESKPKHFWSGKEPEKEVVFSIITPTTKIEDIQVIKENTLGEA